MSSLRSAFAQILSQGELPPTSLTLPLSSATDLFPPSLPSPSSSSSNSEALVDASAARSCSATLREDPLRVRADERSEEAITVEPRKRRTVAAAVSREAHAPEQSSVATKRPYVTDGLNVAPPNSCHTSNPNNNSKSTRDTRSSNSRSSYSSTTNNITRSSSNSSSSSNTRSSSSSNASRGSGSSASRGSKRRRDSEEEEAAAAVATASAFPFLPCSTSPLLLFDGDEGIPTEDESFFEIKPSQSSNSSGDVPSPSSENIRRQHGRILSDSPPPLPPQEEEEKDEDEQEATKRRSGSDRKGQRYDEETTKAEHTQVAGGERGGGGGEQGGRGKGRGRGGVGDEDEEEEEKEKEEEEEGIEEKEEQEEEEIVVVNSPGVICERERNRKQNSSRESCQIRKPQQQKQCSGTYTEIIEEGLQYTNITDAPLVKCFPKEGVEETKEEKQRDKKSEDIRSAVEVEVVATTTTSEREEEDDDDDDRDDDEEVVVRRCIYLEKCSKKQQQNDRQKGKEEDEEEEEEEKGGALNHISSFSSSFSSKRRRARYRGLKGPSSSNSDSSNSSSSSSDDDNNSNTSNSSNSNSSNSKSSNSTNSSSNNNSNNNDSSINNIHNSSSISSSISISNMMKSSKSSNSSSCTSNNNDERNRREEISSCESIYDKKKKKKGKEKKEKEEKEKNTLKILIATDTHAGYKADDPERGDDSFDTLEEILLLAKEHQVDLMLHGGDFFDENKPSRSTVYRTLCLLRKYCIGDGGGVEFEVVPTQYNDDDDNDNDDDDDDSRREKRTSNSKSSSSNSKSKSKSKNSESNSKRGFIEKSCNTNSVDSEDLSEEEDQQQQQQQEEEDEGEGEEQERERKKWKRRGEDEYKKRGNRIEQEEEGEEEECYEGELYGEQEMIKRRKKKKIFDDLNVSQNFRFGLNFTSPHVNVSLPLFAIHGNHDDPAEQSHLSPLDVLEAAHMINYFGRVDGGADNITVRPILFRKGITKVAVYGIGWIRDTRLHRLFCDKKVEFLVPTKMVMTTTSTKTEKQKRFDIRQQKRKTHLSGRGNMLFHATKKELLPTTIKQNKSQQTTQTTKTTKYQKKEMPCEWMNLMLVHQNRYKGAAAGQIAKACIHEHMLPPFLDLIVWGHEHDSHGRPWMSPQRGFQVLQQGSSVATSLTSGEAQQKHVYILEVCGRDFWLTPLPLKSVRPLLFRDISLANVLTQSDGNINKQTNQQQTSSLFLKSSNQTTTGRTVEGDRQILQVLTDIAEALLLQHDKEIAISHSVGKHKTNIEKEELYREAAPANNITPPTFLLLHHHQQQQQHQSKQQQQQQQHMQQTDEDEEEGDEEEKEEEEEEEEEKKKKKKEKKKEKEKPFEKEEDWKNHRSRFLLKLKKKIPLMRLRVEYTGFSTVSAARFGSQFVGRIANPADILLFYKKKKNQTNQPTHAAPRGAKGVAGCPMLEIEEAQGLGLSEIRDIIFHYFDEGGTALDVLPEPDFNVAVQEFVIKMDPTAIATFVSRSVEAAKDAARQKLRSLYPLHNHSEIQPADVHAAVVAKTQEVREERLLAEGAITQNDDVHGHHFLPTQQQQQQQKQQQQQQQPQQQQQQQQQMQQQQQQKQSKQQTKKKKQQQQEEEEEEVHEAEDDFFDIIDVVAAPPPRPLPPSQPPPSLTPPSLPPPLAAGEDFYYESHRSSRNDSATKKRKNKEILQHQKHSFGERGDDDDERDGDEFTNIVSEENVFLSAESTNSTDFQQKPGQRRRRLSTTTSAAHNHHGAKDLYVEENVDPSCGHPKGSRIITQLPPHYLSHAANRHFLADNSSNRITLNVDDAATNDTATNDATTTTTTSTIPTADDASFVAVASYNGLLPTRQDTDKSASGGASGAAHRGGDRVTAAQKHGAPTYAARMIASKKEEREGEQHVSLESYSNENVVAVVGAGKTRRLSIINNTSTIQPRHSSFLSRSQQHQQQPTKTTATSPTTATTTTTAIAEQRDSTDISMKPCGIESNNWVASLRRSRCTARNNTAHMQNTQASVMSATGLKTIAMKKVCPGNESNNLPLDDFDEEIDDVRSFEYQMQNCTGGKESHREEESRYYSDAHGSQRQHQPHHHNILRGGTTSSSSSNNNNNNNTSVSKSNANNSSSNSSSSTTTTTDSSVLNKNRSSSSSSGGGCSGGGNSKRSGNSRSSSNSNGPLRERDRQTGLSLEASPACRDFPEVKHFGREKSHCVVWQQHTTGNKNDSSNMQATMRSSTGIDRGSRNTGTQSDLRKFFVRKKNEASSQNGGSGFAATANTIRSEQQPMKLTKNSVLQNSAATQVDSSSYFRARSTAAPDKELEIFAADAPSERAASVSLDRTTRTAGSTQAALKSRLLPLNSTKADGNLPDEMAEEEEDLFLASLGRAAVRTCQRGRHTCSK